MSDDTEKVVFLAFNNPEVRPEEIDVLACVKCRNKTYRLHCAPNCGAEIYCAACGKFIGKMGWCE